MKRKHKGQLVCQHLEKISRKLLEEYPEVIRQFVKGRHGIYALYRRNRLYYVGLASNLRSRLHHHLRDRHGQTWDRFSIYLTLLDSHLPELESLVLRIASPKGNVQAGKFQRSQDLHRSVRRMIREAQTKEWKELLGEQISLRQIQPKGKDFGVLAQYLDKRIHIRFRYKDKLYIAHVRKDGWMTFAAESAEAKRLQGKEFKSPSSATSAITGRAMNGWRCWKYERSPGEWVLLDELRKR
jgi:hypothetical protein